MNRREMNGEPDDSDHVDTFFPVQDDNGDGGPAAAVSDVREPPNAD